MERVNDFDENAIQQKIHGFQLRREIPTLYKIFVVINDDPSLLNLKYTALQLILKDFHFWYYKINRNSALTKRVDLICWRQDTLKK